MSAVDINFEGPRTLGAWGAVLRRCGPRPASWAPPPPDVLQVQIREYLAGHPMVTIQEITLGLRLPFPQGSYLVRPVVQAMERNGEVRRHKGAWAEHDRRTTVRWEAIRG